MAAHFLSLFIVAAAARKSEYIARPPGAKTFGCTGACPERPRVADVPTAFHWGAVGGKSYLTKMLNQ